MSIEDYAITINGERYAFSLSRIKEICLVSDNGKTKEQEIMENWEIDEATQQPALVSKVNRELKYAGNPQNDTIIYDLVKAFITTILTNDNKSQDTFSDFDFATSITFNTLLSEGIIYKL